MTTFKSKLYCVDKDPPYKFVTIGGTLIMRLKQNLSPNKAQTGFISHKHIPISVEPLDKTIRYSSTKRF